LITFLYLDNRKNFRANTCTETRLHGRVVFIRYRTNAGQPGLLVIHDNSTNRGASLDDSFKFLPYQLSMVRYWLTMVTTGDGELGFDSGEGA